MIKLLNAFVSFSIREEEKVVKKQSPKVEEKKKDKPSGEWQFYRCVHTVESGCTSAVSVYAVN